MVSWIRLVPLALLLGWNGRLHVSCMFHGDDPHQFPFDPHSALLSSSSSPSLVDNREGDFWEEEDESWWEGAEEIDLTLPREQSSEDYLLEDILSNDSCIWKLDCEDFMVLKSPPNSIENIPPPPLPPFLSGLKRIMMDSDPRWKSFKEDFSAHDVPRSEEESDIDPSFPWREDDRDEDQCTLCRWAYGGNDTLYMFSQFADDGTISGSLAGLLVGVGLASAIIGATIMGTLLRCRKMKILPTGSDPCSILMRRSWTKGVSRSEQPTPQAPSNSQRNKDAPSQGTTNRTGWAMKLWRRSSSQAPLNLCSSSENSYSEEPYVNADANSSLYAELNSLGSSQVENTMNAQISNTYSEIPDPAKPLELNICPRTCNGQEGTYENAGYILSEVLSDQNESSAGSTSTPSSAYYSDVSSCEIYNNKKKRKKKKGNEKIQNTCKHSNAATISSTLPSVISGNVPYHPVHINFGHVQPHSLSVQEPLPLSLHVLPKHAFHNRKNLDTTMRDILQHGQGVLNNVRDLNNTLPNGRVVSNVRNYGDLCLTSTNTLQSESCSPTCVQKVPSVQSLSVLSNYHSDQNKNQCVDSSVTSQLYQTRQRPLPPLPSRIITGPQRKNLHVPNCNDNGVPAVPSEYV